MKDNVSRETSFFYKLNSVLVMGPLLYDYAIATARLLSKEGEAKEVITIACKKAYHIITHNKYYTERI